MGMVDPRMLAFLTAFGDEFVKWGFEKLDEATGKATEKVTKKPSFLADVGIGGIGTVIGVFGDYLNLRIDPRVELVLSVLGGSHLGKAIKDYVKQSVASQPTSAGITLRKVPTPAPAPAPAPKPSAGVSFR